MSKEKTPSLPKLLDRKIYKTGQTRGADDDEIYQNRVSRSSTVLIPLDSWKKCQFKYENGYIVLMSPQYYFSQAKSDEALEELGLRLGLNALVFYETRKSWIENNPLKNWKAASSRTSPLGGEYVARIPATTAVENGGKINKGFAETTLKGAGIRVYEYASSDTIKNCRVQLESLFWACRDSLQTVIKNGMKKSDAERRKKINQENSALLGLLDYEKLCAIRAIDSRGVTICPLCLEELSAEGFFSRMEQAEGRSSVDLTVTEINLFHINELRVGDFNHRPYNLGWGHHHCNVVTKDSGIKSTIEWMRRILERNEGRC